MAKKKVILFGGTFDPVHLGHTAVAAFTAKTTGAQKVIFVPAKRSPLKNLFPKASDSDRFAMISLAIAGNNEFELSDFELKKGTPSYTLNTVREFKKEYGEDVEICWLVGADTVEELPYWYKITELIDDCNLCVMYRAGYEKPDFKIFIEQWGSARVAKLQRNTIATPLIDISSTQIRKRIAAGQDISEMLHPDVAAYIIRHGLYR